MSDVKFNEKFVDPATGETVSRIKVPEKLYPDIEKNLNLNAQSANNFMAFSRQIVDLQRKQLAEFDKATQAEKDIAKNVVIIREKMGLDSSWIYNIAMKSMEKREPPPETRTIEPTQTPAG